LGGGEGMPAKLNLPACGTAGHALEGASVETALKD
jgi:hypothetical protein